MSPCFVAPVVRACSQGKGVGTGPTVDQILFYLHEQQIHYLVPQLLFSGISTHLFASHHSELQSYRRSHQSKRATARLHM
jgi:hypothetical protein